MMMTLTTMITTLKLSTLPDGKYVLELKETLVAAGHNLLTELETKTADYI